MNAKKAFLMVLAVVVLTAVVALAAVVMLGGTRDPAGTDTAAGPGGAGDATTVQPTAVEPEPNVEPRPDCPATGVGGIALDCLGGDAGVQEDAPAGEGIVLANVWAWWCGPCRDELPHLQSYADAHPEHTVVGVHADQNASNGAAFLNDLGVDLPSYQDPDNTFAGTLGLPGVVPITTLFVDGEQVAFFPKTFESVAEIEADVGAALAGVS